MTDKSTLSARLRRAADAIDLVTGLGFKVTGSPSMATTEDRPAPAKQQPAKAGKATKSRRFSYRQEVARLFAESPGIKVSEICKRTGAAHSTVSSIVKKLKTEAEADSPSSETQEEQADDSEEESQPLSIIPIADEAPQILSWLAARVREIEAERPGVSILELMSILGHDTPKEIIAARFEIKRQEHGEFWPFKNAREAGQANRILAPPDPNKPHKRRGRKPKERPPKIIKRIYKPIAEKIYSMMAGDVSTEDHLRIQQEIAKRCEEVQATWSPHHRAKAAVCPIEKKRVLHSQGKSTCGFPHIHSTENCRWD